MEDILQSMKKFFFGKGFLKLIILIVLPGYIFVSFTGGDPLSAIMKSNNDHGKDIYIRYCMACHQSDGSGVPGLYPPVISSNWQEENIDFLIEVTLYGLSGEVDVDGEIYDNVMPANTYLTNNQVAAVLNYIGKELNNRKLNVNPADVEAVRGQNR